LKELIFQLNLSRDKYLHDCCPLSHFNFYNLVYRCDSSVAFKMTKTLMIKKTLVLINFHYFSASENHKLTHMNLQSLKTTCSISNFPKTQKTFTSLYKTREWHSTKFFRIFQWNKIQMCVCLPLFNIQQYFNILTHVLLSSFDFTTFFQNSEKLKQNRT
jgi:hypothetical protein